MNTKVRELSSVNQWKDSDAVINWFENIKNKSKCISMQFDIEEFYPLISKALLLKATDYTKGFEQRPLCTQENLFFSVVQICG